MLVLDYAPKVLAVTSALHTDRIESSFRLWEASIEIGPVRNQHEAGGEQSEATCSPETLVDLQ
jgi:hypothetical protein